VHGIANGEGVMDSQEHVDVVLAEIAAEVAKKRRQELEKSLEQVKSKQLISNNQQPDQHPTSTVASGKKKVKVRTAVSPPQGGARSGKEAATMHQSPEQREQSEHLQAQNDLAILFGTSAKEKKKSAKEHENVCDDEKVEKADKSGSGSDNAKSAADQHKEKRADNAAKIQEEAKKNADKREKVTMIFWTTR